VPEDHVEDHCRDGLRVENRQGVDARGSAAHNANRIERTRQGLADRRVIVHDQNV
jgi:hypothetical protein